MNDSAMRATTWERLEYGKLVQAPGGPIVPGSEHGFTGRSAGFPAELAAACHPSRLGLGERDSRRWAHCPWADVGGIVSGVGFVGDEPWVLCARQRERSEAGEGVEGRLYTEVQYAATPAKRYDFDSLYRLATVLHADPLEHVDLTLTPLAVDGAPHAADDALPPGWLHDIAPILMGVMSGQSVNIRDWETRPEEFLRVAARCLAAMPRALRWRVPIGAGLMTMDRSTAFASGMEPVGGLQVVGGALQPVAGVDLTLGEAYVEWLGRVAAECPTTGVLAEAVRDALPHYDAAETIPARVPWSDAARTVARSVTERIRVERAVRALDAGNGLGDVRQFVECRTEVLKALGRRARGPHSTAVAAALAETLNDGWGAAWDAFLTDAREDEQRDREALAALFLVRPLRDPRLLAEAAHVDVQGRARNAAVERFADAVARSTDAAAWEPLARLARGGAAAAGAPVAEWVREWRTYAGADLIWLATRERSVTGQSGPLFQALRDLPEAAAATSLLNGARADLAVIPRLIDAAARAERNDVGSPGNGHAIDAIVEWSAQAGYVWQAFHVAGLAQQAGFATALHDAVTKRRADATPNPRAIALGKEIVELNTPIEPLMLRALLQRRVALETSAWAVSLRARIVERVGDPYASALFDVDPTGQLGDDRTAAEEYYADTAVDDETAERLIKRLSAFRATAREGAVVLLKRWLRDAVGSGGRSTPPYAATLRRLAGDVLKARPLSAKERRIASTAAAALALPRERMLEAAREEWLLDIVADVWPPQTTLPLDAARLRAVLEEVLVDNAALARWHDRVENRRWVRERGWRWVARCAREYDPVEGEALRALAPQHVIALAADGLPVPHDTLSAVGRKDVELGLRWSNDGAYTVPMLVQRLYTLLRVAASARSTSLTEAVSELTLQLARESGLGKVDLFGHFPVEPTFQLRGMLTRLTFSEPQKPIDLVRVVARALNSEPRAFVDRYWDATKGTIGVRVRS